MKKILEQKDLLIFSYLIASNELIINKKILYNFYLFMKENKISFRDMTLMNFSEIFKELHLADKSKNSFDKLMEIFIDEEFMEKIKYNVEKNLAYCIENNIEIISIEDELYPEKLKTIALPPYNLFLKTNNKNLLRAESLKDSFALIGSRTPSKETEKFCTDIATFINEKGLINISGLAKGCDSIGHRATLTNTIAVLGYGLASDIYPKENEALADEIVESGGILLTELLPDTNVDAIKLIERNRIITALADNVCICELNMKSGTAHSFKYAKQQQKNIYIKASNSEFITKHKKNLIVIENKQDLNNMFEKKKIDKLVQKNIFDL